MSDVLFGEDRLFPGAMRKTFNETPFRMSSICLIFSFCCPSCHSLIFLIVLQDSYISTQAVSSSTNPAGGGSPFEMQLPEHLMTAFDFFLSSSFLQTARVHWWASWLNNQKRKKFQSNVVSISVRPQTPEPDSALSEGGQLLAARSSTIMVSEPGKEVSGNSEIGN